MFFKDKREKEILKQQKELEKKLDEIKKEKEALQKEREQLLKIQEMMKNTNNIETIDISNVYVWRKKNVYYLVNLKEEKAIEKGNSEIEYHGYKATLTDIFSEKIVYEKFSSYKIEKMQEIVELGELYNTYLTPIYEFDRNLLVYADKKVPKHVLLQLYYNLNNIDLTEPTLKK